MDEDEKGDQSDPEKHPSNKKPQPDVSSECFEAQLMDYDPRIVTGKLNN